MDVTEGDKIDIGGGSNCENEIAKRSPLPKNLNENTGYLTLNAKQAFIQ